MEFESAVGFLLGARAVVPVALTSKNQPSPRGLDFGKHEEDAPDKKTGEEVAIPSGI